MIDTLEKAQSRRRAAEELCSLLDDIGAQECEIRQLQAKQVSAIASFTQGRRDFDFDLYGVWNSTSRRLVAMELADAKQCGVDTAERLMWECLRLREGHLRIMEAFTDGRLSLQAVRAAVGETLYLDSALVPLADEILAEDLVDVLPGQARVVARTRVLELDPDAADQAASAARADRFVSISQGAVVGMATLTCGVPAEQAAACWHALDRHARAVYADGDPRTVSQIMVDTLVERVTGLSAAEPVPAAVSVVMSDLTLLGLEDRPAQLGKVGPIPPATARRLAMSDQAWVRRLYTDPLDATVQLVDTRRRRFDKGLRELVLARDQVCRTPGCGSSIRDVDHTEEWSKGGATSASNGRGRCKRCHRARHHINVVVQGSPRLLPLGSHDAYERWQTPIGRVLASLPPPALGVGTATREQSRVRRRARDQLIRQRSPRAPSSMERALADLLTRAS